MLKHLLFESVDASPEAPSESCVKDSMTRDDQGVDRWRLSSNKTQPFFVDFLFISQMNEDK